MNGADNFTTSQLHALTCELVDLWDNITTSHTPRIYIRVCELVNLSRPDNFTGRARTGVGARGHEDDRRAGQETRKRHDARTSGWHPFEGVAGPASEGARGSYRRGQRTLSRHVFLAPRNRGIRPKLDAKPPVFAEIVRKRRTPGHAKAEIFELTGPRHGAEGSTGEPKHE